MFPLEQGRVSPRRAALRVLRRRPLPPPPKSRNSRTAANSSGSWSRKASWPLLLSISRNCTGAPAASSASAIRLFSAVGNSQSLVKDTTRNRAFAVAKAAARSPPWSGREIEIVHRAADVEIGVGVEALDEAAALMAQIAFHLEIRPEAEGQRSPVLQSAAEFPRQRGFRQIGDVGDHAGHRQPRRAVPLR